MLALSPNRICNVPYAHAGHILFSTVKVDARFIDCSCHHRPIPGSPPQPHSQASSITASFLALHHSLIPSPPSTTASFPGLLHHSLIPRPPPSQPHSQAFFITALFPALHHHSLVPGPPLQPCSRPSTTASFPVLPPPQPHSQSSLYHSLIHWPPPSQSHSWPSSTTASFPVFHHSLVPSPPSWPSTITASFPALHHSLVPRPPPPQPHSQPSTTTLFPGLHWLQRFSSMQIWPGEGLEDLVMCSDVT